MCPWSLGPAAATHDGPLLGLTHLPSGLLTESGTGANVFLDGDPASPGDTEVSHCMASMT